MYVKPKAKESTVADWEFGDRSKMSKNFFSKARKKGKEKNLTLKKRRSGNKRLPKLEVKSVVEINNEFAENVCAILRLHVNTEGLFPRRVFMTPKYFHNITFLSAHANFCH